MKMEFHQDLPSADFATPRLSAAMACVGALAAGLAVAVPGRPAWLGAAEASLPIAMAWLVRRGVTRRRGHASLESPALLFGIAVATASVPLVTAVMGVIHGGQWPPIEVTLLRAGRNVSLALLAVSGAQSCQRLAGFLSLCLVLFATTLAPGGVWVIPLVSAYAALGCTWLTRLHCQGHGRPAQRVRFPMVATSLAASFVGLVIVVAAFGTPQVVPGRRGWVRSSGGLRDGSDAARSGIGDGSDEVAGTRSPHAVGFDQSDAFINSERASLYDAFVENYGEPTKSRDFRKMIFLKPTTVRLLQGAAREDLRSGRSFSVAREPPPGVAQPASERAADALLYVRGETPLHLPLAAYDQFDGQRWHEAPAGQLGCEIIKDDGASTWMSLAWERLPDVFAGARLHQVRVGSLNVERLPLPSHPMRFRMGRVDKPDFFTWDAAGLLKLARRTVPTGAVLDVESRTVDPQRLRTRDVEPTGPWTRRFLQRVTPDPGVAALARGWVADVPRGWPQVERVVDRLRLHAALDRAARTDGADAADDPVAHFLLRSRRGPDYLFASAAVALLRELGYPCRLVGGFYADPARYDRSSDQTPLTARDAHFWAEVLLPEGVWIEVEPTPGYELARPGMPWWRRGAIAAHGFARRHWPAGLGLIAFACALVRSRARVADWVATFTWHATLFRADDRFRALATLRLVDRRLYLAGRGRPLGVTPRRWFAATTPALPASCRAPLFELAALVDRAAFAPDVGEVAAAACRRLGRELTLRSLRPSRRGCTLKGVAH